MIVPEELFPDPHSRPRRPRGSAGERIHPGLVARLLARARSFTLDGELATGLDPSGSPLRAARALTLTSHCGRADLAEGLRRLADGAHAPRRGPRGPPDRIAVRLNEPTIRALARRLTGPEPLYAPGLARLERLLTDSGGPAYTGDALRLAEELSAAEAQLDGAWPSPGAR